MKKKKRTSAKHKTHKGHKVGTVRGGFKKIKAGTGRHTCKKIR